MSQHQWQKNIIVAEKFMFDTNSIDNVIVGSSLANRLVMDSLPSFYNLSMSGQSVFDGFSILRKTPTLPNCVFVEINFLSRNENVVFKEIISSPIQHTLKKSFDVFRTDKHPLAYFEKKLFRPLVQFFLKKIVYKLRDRMVPGSDKINKEDLGNSLFEKMLILRKKEHSEQIDTLKMNQQFQLLSDNVNYLKSKGVKVVFFEMPIHPYLIKLDQATYLRNKIKKVYPHHEFIELPNNIEDYKTTDGHHLTTDEAKIYSRYFNKAAASL